MKKQVVGLSALLILSMQFVPMLSARGGGEAVAGALGGLAVGTMLGSAVSGQNHNSSRAERAEDKADQVRAEQERQRVAQLEREMDRRDMEHRLAQERKAGEDSRFMILMVLVVALLLGVGALGFFLMHKK